MSILFFTVASCIIAIAIAVVGIFLGLRNASKLQIEQRTIAALQVQVHIESKRADEAEKRERNQGYKIEDMERALKICEARYLELLKKFTER